MSRPTLFFGSGALVEKYKAKPAGDVQELEPGESFQFPIPPESGEELGHYWFALDPDNQKPFWMLYQRPPLVSFLDQSCVLGQLIPQLLQTAQGKFVFATVMTPTFGRDELLRAIRPFNPPRQIEYGRTACDWILNYHANPRLGELVVIWGHR